MTDQILHLYGACGLFRIFRHDQLEQLLLRSDRRHHFSALDSHPLHRRRAERREEAFRQV